MLASRRTLPHWSRTFTYMTTLWSRQFTTWPLSPAQKQNSLLWDVVLVRHAAKKTFPKSLLSPTPSMQLKRYLIIKPICIKSIQQPSLANFGNFLLYAKEILLNFGNALANSSGDFTDLLTKIQNCSIPSPYSWVKYPGTIAKNLIVITSLICGKWHSKHQMEKVDTSSISLMTTSKTSNCLTSKGAYSSNPSVILTCYMLKLQEPLQTMPR